MSFEPAFIKIS